MQDRVAVWTDRPQVLDRIDYRLAPDFGQRPDVVDVDIPVRLGAVYRPEAEPADAAGGAVGRDAPPAGLRVALIGVDQNPIPRPLLDRGRGVEFVREKL